ncbi:hypothetical protein L9F63_016288, partial [Diploptera punctata]
TRNFKNPISVLSSSKFISSFLFLLGIHTMSLKSSCSLNLMMMMMMMIKIIMRLLDGVSGTKVHCYLVHRNRIRSILISIGVVWLCQVTCD